MKAVRKKRSPPKQSTPATEPGATYPLWRAAVLGLLDKRTASTTRGWSNMFVRGLTPEQAADEISRNAYNVTRDRLKRRR
jgi:hypothetical protein